MDRVSFSVVRTLRVMYLILALGVPVTGADLVREAVDKVSTGQYQTYEALLENMGLGFYGGPEYNQGSRGRDGWIHGGTLGNQEAQLFLVDQFSSMGLDVSVQGAYGNVVAQWPGTETPQKIYILCAHYDTTSGDEEPGGDDNASGTAGVLEAARVLAQYRFQSTVRFIAFNAEEDWMEGSREYVNALPKGTNIAGVINLDMILRPAWDYHPEEPVDLEVETRKTPACTAWMEAFVQAATAYCPRLVIDPKSHYPDDWTSGDQGPFLLAGYAAFTAVENTAEEMWYCRSNLYYHTGQDSGTALANSASGPGGAIYDYDFATNVVKATVATLAMQAVPVAPRFPSEQGQDALEKDAVHGAAPVK